MQGRNPFLIRSIVQSHEEITVKELYERRNPFLIRSIVQSEAPPKDAEGNLMSQSLLNQVNRSVQKTNIMLTTCKKVAIPS